MTSNVKMTVNSMSSSVKVNVSAITKLDVTLTVNVSNTVP